MKDSKLIKCPVRKERFRLSAKLPVDVIEGFITPFTRLVNSVRGTKELAELRSALDMLRLRMAIQWLSVLSTW